MKSCQLILDKLNQIYLILDDKGGIIEHNGLDKLYTEETIETIKTIYQINPSISYISWIELLNEARDQEIVTQDSFFLSADNTVSRCQILLSHNDGQLMYVMIPDMEVSSDDTIAVIDDGGTEAEQWSYEHSGPHSLLYVDAEGVIFFENEAFIRLYGKSAIGDNVNDLFLESDVGRIPMGLKFSDEKDQELTPKMIIRVKPKMRIGYNRCTRHTHDGKTFYRLEFALDEDIHLIDESLGSAIAEIDKLKENADAKNSLLAEYTTPDFSFDQIVTTSDNYKKVLVSVAQVADTNTTVLISGETGSGKELLANAIFRLSDRSDKPFVKINCANIPAELVESILFGHEKGSFTDAHAKQIGKFELADGGTIFLDEIGELPYAMQSKLLRVLQEGEIERIGNPESIKVDVRIIAATNRNLKAESAKGEFRSDLYFRLNVFPIYSLPLRERKEDIPMLVDHFIKKYTLLSGRENVTSIKKIDLQMLKNYDYPGNIRELENIIHRGIILAEDNSVNLSFLLSPEQSEDSTSTLIDSLDNTIKNHIIAALKISSGKLSGKNSASELLDINAKTLYSKLKKYEINIKEYSKND